MFLFCCTNVKWLWGYLKVPINKTYYYYYYYLVIILTKALNLTYKKDACIHWNITNWFADYHLEVLKLANLLVKQLTIILTIKLAK